MSSVWYIGAADVRTIDSTEWTRISAPGSTKTWDKTNGWSIAQSSFTSPQLDILDDLSEFVLTSTDGPRPGSIVTAAVDNTITPSDLAEAIGNSAPDVQVFSTPGTGFTWVKPAGAKVVEVVCISAGSGGGSGARRASGTASSGGAGGGGGGYSRIAVKASDLASNCTVNVGAGTAGGAAVTANDTNGNNGAASGSAQVSEFLTGSQKIARAATAGAGVGGQSGASSTGGSGGGGTTIGGAGAAGASATADTADRTAASKAPPC